MTIFEKAKVIASDYDRSYRQKELAEKYDMSRGRIGKITRAMGYSHGKLVTDNNLYPGQKYQPVYDIESIEKELSFLDKYPDSKFVKEKKEKR